MRARAFTLLSLAALTACAGDDRSACGSPPTLHARVRLNAADSRPRPVDLLLVLDDSRSMEPHAAVVQRRLDGWLNALVSPPDANGDGSPDYAPVARLRVGVASTDLGCDAGALGDDGRLHPLAHGHAMTSRGERVDGCDDPNAFPRFFTFDARDDSPEGASRYFACTSALTTRGCEVEQPLEAAYRALIVHDAREREGNTSPNAGFVRDGAWLWIVVVSDEDDASVRDCRYAVAGEACDDATDVFDPRSTRWASTDLQQRFYRYAPGSAQDPTWPLERYLDPAHFDRGFLAIKPGRPWLVQFVAVTGVPSLRSPVPFSTDWRALLGEDPTGADAYTANTPEGRVSMRPADPDPDCPARVLPACRAPGTAPSCDASQQPYAWPARRLATLARRFSETFNSGAVASLCDADDDPTFLRDLLRQRESFEDCPPRFLPLDPPECCETRDTAGCSTAPGCARTGVPARLRCSVVEHLSPRTDLATWCTAAHGRHPAGRVGARETCVVDALTVPLGTREAPPGAHGFFYDLSPNYPGYTCARRLAFTPGDEPPPGAEAVLECDEVVSPSPAPDACAGP